MLKRILLVIVLFVAALAVVVATQPDAYRVERTTEIAAPPAVVFDLVSDLKAFNSWNPWVEMDPSIEQSYGEKTAGVGATYEWKGEKTGSGKMTIIASEKPSKLMTRLDFYEPMAGRGTSGFSLTTLAGGTRIIWWMDGRNSFVAKAFSLIMDMDEMIGGTYARGLEKLKALAEAEHAKREKAAAEAEAEAKAKAEVEAKAKAEAEAKAKAEAEEKAKAPFGGEKQ